MTNKPWKNKSGCPDPTAYEANHRRRAARGGAGEGSENHYPLGRF